MLLRRRLLASAKQDARRWEVLRRALAVAAVPCGSHQFWCEASVGRAVHLLVEAFGVQSAGRGGNAGENRKSNQGGYDGLHGKILQTMQAAQLPPVIDERKHRTLPVNPLSPGEQFSKIGAPTGTGRKAQDSK